MTLPAPDTHCFDEDEQKDVWSYSRELVEQMLAERDAVLKQALSALDENYGWVAHRLDAIAAIKKVLNQ